jgi:hypothetical protein
MSPVRHGMVRVERRIGNPHADNGACRYLVSTRGQTVGEINDWALLNQLADAGRWTGS